MRAITMLALAVLLLTALTACGGDEPSETAERPTPEAGAAAEAPPAPMPEIKKEGYVRTFVEAGFTVFWPSGCGELTEQVSSRSTGWAEREFIYNCNRASDKSAGVGIRVFQGAHDRDGNPPSPELTVDLLERQIQKSGSQIQRQRPLKADGIEGLDVFAAEEGGSGEVWIRGLLKDDDIYLLMAWNQAGGLFQDAEVVDFFASFRAEVP